MRTRRHAPTAAELVTDALAVYRAAVLLQDDSIPPLPKLRDKLMDRYGATPWGELLDCKWCLSVWLAGGAVAARALTPRIWSVLARVLALSAVTGIVHTALHPEPTTEIRVSPDTVNRALAGG